CPAIPYAEGCPCNDNVTLADGSPRAIRDLQVGDLVWTISDDMKTLVLSEVITMLHNVRNRIVRFHTVETVTGHRVSLTSAHYVRVSHFEYLSASQLTLNHSLYVVDKTTGNIREARIQSIKIENKQGAFNPVTLHGTLLANGIFASSYANVFGWSHETFQNMATPFRLLYYLTKYLGIHQAIWTNNDEFVWAAKPFLYLDNLNYYIPFTSMIICIFVTFHLIYVIYNFIMRKCNQLTNLMNWKKF
ncbi:unnamed protein product, partial [Adineta steineri]